MTKIEAPAKLNLSLLVRPPRSNGLHPIDSLVQTIEWCDELEFEPGEGADSLEVTGDVEVEVDGNLVIRSLIASREFGDVPPLRVVLRKQLPLAAGLGGGSSDAAAALLATSLLGNLPRSALPEVASTIGSDVALFLTGGSLMVGGVGEAVERIPPLEDFAVAVALPEFGLSTPDVYTRWDELEGPTGPEAPDSQLPPSLRDQMPMRNDLLPAALDLAPTMGDFMADVAAKWGTFVSMTGSGSACFGYFATLDEARDAAASVSHLARIAVGASLRGEGVKRVPQPIV